MATKILAWTDSKALALAQQPGTHKHPTVPGFLMQVSPKLHAVYRWRFVNAKGLEDVGKFGIVGPVTKGAHICLEDALTLFEKKRKADNVRRRVGALTLDAAYEEWSKEAKRGGAQKSAETLEYYDKAYKRYIQPEAGEWELADATSEDWDALLTKAKEKSKSQTRGMFWMLHGIYHFYMTEKETLDRNPLAKRRLKDKFNGDDTKRVVKTHIPAIDLEAFVTGVLALAKRVKQSKRAIMMLLLTGWRRSAIFRMKWNAIDWERGIYTVVRKEKGDVTDLQNSAGWKWFRGEMALNDYVLAYLQERRAEDGEAESEYVFPSRHGTRPHMCDVRGSIDKACLGMGFRISPHDLRRTFATIAEIVLDGNMRLVGLLLAHSQAEDAVQAPDSGSGKVSATTNKYIVRNLQAERVSGTLVAEAILQIAGCLPLDEELAAKFKARGVDIRKISLMALEDDDSDALAAEVVGAGTVAEYEGEEVAGVEDATDVIMRAMQTSKAVVVKEVREVQVKAKPEAVKPAEAGQVRDRGVRAVRGKKV